MPLCPRILFASLLLLLSFYLPAQAASDFGASHNLILKAKLSDDWFVISRSNMASRDDGDEYFLGYFGASLGYQINKEWSIRGGFRQAYFKIGESWREEQRPMLEGYYAKMIDGFRFTSRSRLEFRFLDFRDDDDIRLRQEFTLTAPWKLTNLELQPYIGNETFYSIENEWIEANWLDAGLSFSPWQGAKLKMGYRLNKIRIQGEFTTRHTLVTGLYLFF